MMHPERKRRLQESRAACKRAANAPTAGNVHFSLCWAIYWLWLSEHLDEVPARSWPEQQKLIRQFSRYQKKLI